MIVISSPANHNLSAIRRLRQRKERNNTGLAYIEGLRIVTDAIRQRKGNIETLLYSPDLLTSTYGQELVDKCYKQGMEIWSLSANAFNSIALKEGPQGLAALVRQSWNDIGEIAPAAPLNVVLGLYEIADPGNLGTIMRTADAVGCSDVILIGDCTDPYDPTAVRASMGTLFAHRKVRMSLDAFLEWQSEHGLPIVATSDQGDEDYHRHRYQDPMILLMGSERQGLPASVLEACETVVRIPMSGIADSLNLSIATAVSLYEVFRQRQDSAGTGR